METTEQTMRRGAVLSGCDTYRYLLTREWDDDLPPCAFLMLNPSTADAHKDDRTIRRCIGFARSWGFGSLLVYNIFALRSTDPKALYSHADPVGPENNDYLNKIERGVPIVAAWGGHGKLRGRGHSVRQMLRYRLSCLGTTSDGHPLHPLYQPASTVRKPYPFAPGDHA